MDPEDNNWIGTVLEGDFHTEGVSNPLLWTPPGSTGKVVPFVLPKSVTSRRERTNLVNQMSNLARNMGAAVPLQQVETERAPLLNALFLAECCALVFYAVSFILVIIDTVFDIEQREDSSAITTSMFLWLSVAQVGFCLIWVVMLRYRYDVLVMQHKQAHPRHFLSYQSHQRVFAVFSAIFCFISVGCWLKERQFHNGDQFDHRYSYKCQSHLTYTAAYCPSPRMPEWWGMLKKVVISFSTFETMLFNQIFAHHQFPVLKKLNSDTNSVLF